MTVHGNGVFEHVVLKNLQWLAGGGEASVFRHLGQVVQHEAESMVQA